MGNQKRNVWVRILAALVTLAAFVGIGLGIGWKIWPAYHVQVYDNNGRLTRGDLPGFGCLRNSEDGGKILAAENHCNYENAVTVVDETGRAWHLQASGWNLQWAMTNAVGAALLARNVQTGEVHWFYLGKNAGQFSFCPQQLGEDLTIDCGGRSWFFFGKLWQLSEWPAWSFRAFAQQLQVMRIDRQGVGQTVALGDDLNLEQTATFCGSLLLENGKQVAPEVTLWYEPFFFEEGDPEKITYTSANDLEWTLMWFDSSTEQLAEEGTAVYASCGIGGYLEIALSKEMLQQQNIQTMGQAVEAAERVLDHISRRT